MLELEARVERARQKGEELAEAEQQLARFDPSWRDWGGLPIEVLAKIAETHIAQTEATWEARLESVSTFSKEEIQARMADRKRKGNCLLVFARVCKPWRQAQLHVGLFIPLRQVLLDTLRPNALLLETRRPRRLGLRHVLLGDLGQHLDRQLRPKRVPPVPPRPGAAPGAAPGFPRPSAV